MSIYFDFGLWSALTGARDWSWFLLVLWLDWNDGRLAGLRRMFLQRNRRRIHIIAVTVLLVIVLVLVLVIIAALLAVVLTHANAALGRDCTAFSFDVRRRRTCCYLT